MSLFKKLIKLFSCKSECQFNNNKFDFTILEAKMSDFELKNKDIQVINRILSKRKKKNFKSITEV